MSLAIGRLRPIAPLLGLLALFLALLVLSIVQMAGQANLVEAERSRAAVDAGFNALIDRSAGLVNDNANWDDAVVAVYRRPLDTGFAVRAWTTSTADHVNYDAVHVVDADGRTLYSGADGQTIAPRPLPAAVLALGNRVDPTRRSTAALMRLNGALSFVSLGMIEPTDRSLEKLVPAAGPHRLVLVRRVTATLLAQLSSALLLDDLRFGAAGPGRESIDLTGPDGGAIATVSWLRRMPGNEATLRALPALSTAMIVFLAICAVITRGTIASVRELARQAVIDSLSQLPNRRALRKALRQGVALDAPMALALLDLDGFKGVNDNYGHAVGDRLIRAVADVLRTLAGDTILVARLGGDEFALLATGHGAHARMDELCRALLARLGHPFRLDERTIVIGGSFGIATRDDAAIDPAELLRRADVAMYAAKRSGRMRIVGFDADLDARQAMKHRIEAELRVSIVAGDFDVVYQPLIAADRVTMQGVEALLRWTSPTLGPVAPEVFVPIAEETGLIDRIGLFVLDRACREAAAWGELNLAVNVSAAQLRNPDFPDQLADILADTGFPATRLEVEITETYLVREADAARVVLDALRALGVTVSLDDFGTGFASIGFLRQFTFDKLKIDRSLVADAEYSATARAMVQASVAVARALDMSVTAEGIETLAQADVMRIIGCDELQGWLFSHAETADQITARQALLEDRAPLRRAIR